MSKKVFNLSDFDSRACDITVVSDGDQKQTLSLRKFTLLDRLWVEREFGSLTRWEKTLFPDSQGYDESKWLEALLKTTFHLLEKEHQKLFSGWEDLASKLDSTINVLTGLQKALLYVLHGSEAVIETIDDEVKKNFLNEKPKATTKKKKKTKTGQK